MRTTPQSAPIPLPDDGPAAALVGELRRFALRTLAECTLAEPNRDEGENHRWIVAFSGGPDSTALLWGLAELRAELGLELVAAHLDHALDPGSAERARGARELAERIGVPFVEDRLEGHDPEEELRFEEGPEAWARHHRYRFLEGVAEERRASAILTAHHADDQAETVLLRLLFGSGLDGLAGIAPQQRELASTPLLRPLLDLRRGLLEAALAEIGPGRIEPGPVIDPTNADLHRPRNRIRHLLLPRLEQARLPRESPDLVRRLCRLATGARRARRRLQSLAIELADLRTAARPRATDDPWSLHTPWTTDDGARADRRRLAALPESLADPVLSALDRLAGRPYPTAASARRDLRRRLRAEGPIGCDAGEGWRWQGDSRHLWLLPPRAAVGEFTYTLGIPGSVRLDPLELELRIRLGPVAEWMFRGHPDRVALAPPGPGARLQVRNRRPGDRIRPLGRHSSKRLKELLIDQGAPRHRRDLLPLLIIDDELAWVPGITLSDRFRLDGHERALIVTLGGVTPGGVTPGGVDLDGPTPI